MNKKRNENRLSDKVKSEIDKAQQLANSNHHKEQLFKFASKKLNNDLIQKADLIKNKVEPSQLLKDRIEQRQSALDDLVAEIESGETEQYDVMEVVKLMIAELRRYNLRKADEFELLLVPQRHTRKVKRKNSDL